MSLARTTFSITDFGAVGDGLTLATPAISAAVAAAARSRLPHELVQVVVPCCGTFLSGAFSLASGVLLRLEQGAILRASTNQSDYPLAGWNWDPALIDTSNATATGIIGAGTIDGQAPGPYWSTGFDPNRSYFIPRTWEGLGGGCVGECRPKLVRFCDSSNVTLSGDSAGSPLRLRNAPDWTMLFRRCEVVDLRWLDVYGDSRWPNNDGVDFESVSNVDVRDSSASCAADRTTGTATNSMQGVEPASPVLNTDRLTVMPHTQQHSTRAMTASCSARATPTRFACPLRHSHLLPRAAPRCATWCCALTRQRSSSRRSLPRTTRPSRTSVSLT